MPKVEVLANIEYTFVPIEISREYGIDKFNVLVVVESNLTIYLSR